MATGGCMGHRDRRSASLEDLSALYQAKKLESIRHYVPPASNIIALYPKDICRVFSWVSMHLLSYSLMSPAYQWYSAWNSAAIVAWNRHCFRCSGWSTSSWQGWFNHRRWIRPRERNLRRWPGPWPLMKTTENCHTVVCVLFTRWGLGRHYLFISDPEVTTINETHFHSISSKTRCRTRNIEKLVLREWCALKKAAQLENFFIPPSSPMYVNKI